MSCFGGRMREYRFLSIDRFDGDNLLSKMFFLSHAHDDDKDRKFSISDMTNDSFVTAGWHIRDLILDHMYGLDHCRLVSHLAANDLKLYVHVLTAHILRNDPKYRHLDPYLVELEVEEPMMLPVPSEYVCNGTDSDTITVTLLPAGHCPGSVMFLFEGSEGTVLYTGDIRLTGSDLMEMQGLMAGERVKEIKSIYFDSTFCTYDTPQIVNRQESLRAAVELAQSHLNKDKNNKVLLFCNQKYGHEYLMWKMSQQLNMKIHVTESKREFYQKIPQISPYMTTDGLGTRLHACAYFVREDEDQKINGRRPGNEPRTHGKRSRYSIPSCPECRSYDRHVMVIKPSMLWFQQSRSIRDIVYYDEQAGGIYRLQYSCHSSLSEIRELLRYLNPKEAWANVKPFRYKDFTPIYNAIKDLVPAVASYSPKKYDSMMRLISGEDGGARGSTCNERERREEYEPNFTNRNRFIESALARQKRSLFDDPKPPKRPKKEKREPETWEDCVNISSDSDSGSDSESGKEEEDAHNTSFSSTSSAAWMDSSDSSSPSKRVEASGKGERSSTAGQGSRKAEGSGEVKEAPKSSVEVEEATKTWMGKGRWEAPKPESMEDVTKKEARAEKEGKKNDPKIEGAGKTDPEIKEARKEEQEVKQQSVELMDEEVDPEDNYVLHLTSSSDQSDDRKDNEAGYDSDIDLFDPVDRPDEEEAAALKKADSLEFLGEFRKNANPPVITICSQDDFLETPEPEQPKKDGEAAAMVVEMEMTKQAEIFEEIGPVRHKTMPEKDTLAKKNAVKVTTPTITLDDREPSTAKKTERKPRSATKSKEKTMNKETTPKKTRGTKRMPSLTAMWLQQILEDDEADKAWILGKDELESCSGSTTTNDKETTSGRRAKSQM